MEEQKLSVAITESDAVERMFENEHFYCGGPIPNYAIKDPENVKLLNIKLTQSVDIAHEALGRVNKLAKSKYRPRMGERLIPKIIHMCEEKNLQQEMIGGLILLYLELVEGCEWRYLVDKQYEFKDKTLCVKAG
jgi:hypothetical protein